MAVLTYKCPNCEGPLKWDGGKKKFICEYCDSAFSEEEIKKLNPDSKEAQEVSREEAEFLGVNVPEAAEPSASGDAESGQAERKTPVSMKAASAVKIYSCPSCGAQIAADPTVAATECFYCGSPVVLSDKFQGSFDPDYVIAFDIDKKKASEIFKEWLKQHKYVPEAFYKDRIDEIKGVYFPYWVYSGKLDSVATGEGRNLNVYRMGDTEYTETSVYEIYQPGSIEINDISCIALKNANKVLCESVIPFKLEKKQDFEPVYMQGYMAEIRDIDKSEIEPQINAEAEEYAKNQITSSIESEFDSVTLDKININTVTEKYSYVMLPVWTLTYKGNDGKIYYFSINGQTGKTCGELPVDNSKLKKLFISIAAPLFVVLMLFFYFVL
mgnify:FL=1